MKYLSLAIIIASVSSFPVICVIFAMKSKYDSLEMDMGGLGNRIDNCIIHNSRCYV